MDVRLHFCNLIFFAFLILCGCKQQTTNAISIVWNNGRAIAVSIPESVFAGSTTGSITDRLKVYVEKNKLNAIIGEYSVEEENVVFKPLVPFTNGLNYEVYFDRLLVGRITVPGEESLQPPQLLSLYPTADTLPENLLKVYLQFSAPMREGESGKHIALINHNNDTLQGVFLDLQPELWNEERTALTIWLDPGRIKRDLIPNQLLGNPLQKGERYTIAISGEWKNASGEALQQPFFKQFIVAERDSVMPDVALWKLAVPAILTRDPLRITLNEPLDYFLLQESISIVANNKEKVDGKIVVSDNEKQLQFIPVDTWAMGEYRLQVDPALEDLAGNNLSRPFDRDLQAKTSDTGKTIFEIFFKIK